MSKVVSLSILVGLMLSAVAVINVNGANARQQTDFIQISVLAENQANYGVDENLGIIPAVSIEIIEDKIHDSQGKSVIPVITYTSLPAKDEKPEGQDNNASESARGGRPQDDPGNGNGNGNNNGNGMNADNNPGNGNGTDVGNRNQNGNGRDKDNGKDKDKNHHRENQSR